MRGHRTGRRRRVWLAVVLAAVVLAAACGGESTPAQTRLRLALDWVPNPDHVGLYYASERGLLAQRGLEVDAQAPSDPSAGLKLVATGRFDLAISYEPEVYFAVEENLPVVAVAAVIPTPLNSVIALADSDVKSLEDLRNGTVGVAGLPFDDAVLETIRRQHGFGEEEVKKINVGFNLVPSLLSRNVDAVIGAYRNVEGIQLEQETGEKPLVIPLDEVGVPTYDELVVVANSDRLESDSGYAELVRAFVAALVEGTEQAIADPEGGLSIMAEVTDYEPSFLAESVPATLALLRPEGRGLGCMDIPAWERFGAWMLETGLLSDPVDASRAATNDYLPAC